MEKVEEVGGSFGCLRQSRQRWIICIPRHGHMYIHPAKFENGFHSILEIYNSTTKRPNIMPQVIDFIHKYWRIIIIIQIFNILFIDCPINFPRAHYSPTLNTNISLA